jgi:hypothetical protein
VSHTKGPWRANGNGVHTETGQCVALGYMDPMEQRWDDARLIAAAPELLEACKGFVEQFGPYEDDSDKDTRRLLGEMKAAIAKAEGR